MLNINATKLITPNSCFDAFEDAESVLAYTVSNE